MGGLVTVSSSNPLPVGGKSVQNQHHSHDLLTQLLMRLMMRLQTARQNQPCLVLLTVQMQTGSGLHCQNTVIDESKTCTARFRLSFYHTAPSPVNDNAPKPMLYANKDKLIGSIDLDPCKTEDTSSDALMRYQQL